jgi:hypothetical protein
VADLASQGIASLQGLGSSVPDDDGDDQDDTEDDAKPTTKSGAVSRSSTSNRPLRGRDHAARANNRGSRAFGADHLTALYAGQLTAVMN